MDDLVGPCDDLHIRGRKMSKSGNVPRRLSGIFWTTSKDAGNTVQSLMSELLRWQSVKTYTLGCTFERVTVYLLSFRTPERSRNAETKRQ